MLIIPPFPRKRRRPHEPAAAPEPPPPITPAHVVSTGFGGQTVTLTFDRPLAIVESPLPDDAITVNGAMPTSVALGSDAAQLVLEMPSFVNAGDAWTISRQPGWVVTDVAWPESGNL